MNPEHHRQLARLLRRSGRIDVQVQAILIRTGVEKQIVLPNMALLATRAELRRIAHSLPCHRPLRRLPAQFANGRRGVGQTKKSHLRTTLDPLACRLTLRGLYRRLRNSSQHQAAMPQHATSHCTDNERASLLHFKSSSRRVLFAPTIAQNPGGRLKTSEVMIPGQNE